MSFANPGVSGLILIVIVLLIFFGPSKLPEIGKAFGKSLREFKDAAKGILDDTDVTSTAGQSRASEQGVSAASASAQITPIELKKDSDSES